jgi:hypothetical protein
MLTKNRALQILKASNKSESGVLSIHPLDAQRSQLAMPAFHFFACLLQQQQAHEELTGMADHQLPRT